MDRAFLAYRAQMYHARFRKIEWLFTFETWVKWWETELGPKWLELRGCKAGQFQMSRKGDKGPYAFWNVTCDTTEENSRKRNINKSPPRGAMNGSSKLTSKEVLRIFTAKNKSFSNRKLLAARYGVHHRHIYRIWACETWRHVTEKL